MDRAGREDTFHADVVDGRIVLHDKAAYRDYVDRLDNQPVTITVSRYYSRRTNQQNRYYWGCLINLISEETGHCPTDIHDMLKRMFLKPKLIEIRSEVYEADPSTKSITTIEMMDYVETIRAWAGQALGLTIPSPGEF